MGRMGGLLIYPKKTLSAASETVAKGVYDPTTLSAVDADLASANIKSAINIFGKAGAATVQEIGAADAAVADVKAPKTFFSVTGGIKTGTIPTVALAADNSAYPAGYHAGAASLAAVDADLAAANILSGKNIFGFTGPATVQDIADADLTIAEAPTGKKFYAVTGGVKTGTGTKTLDPANDTVAAGYYAATTLSAVDVDLAVGNIKSGVTIFGKAGTLALVEDILGTGSPGVGATSGYTASRLLQSIAGGGSLDVSLTQTYAAISLAVGFATGLAAASGAGLKVRLIMNGVQVAETADLPLTEIDWRVASGTRALSGSVACIGRVYNSSGGALDLIVYNAAAAAPSPVNILVGSAKL